MIPAKITPKHLKRTAYVYVRQSTLSQVQDNLESRRLGRASDGNEARSCPLGASCALVRVPTLHYGLRFSVWQVVLYAVNGVQITRPIGGEGRCLCVLLGYTAHLAQFVAESTHRSHTPGGGYDHEQRIYLPALKLGVSMFLNGVRTHCPTPLASPWRWAGAALSSQSFRSR